MSLIATKHIVLQRGTLYMEYFTVTTYGQRMLIFRYIRAYLCQSSSMSFYNYSLQITPLHLRGSPAEESITKDYER